MADNSQKIHLGSTLSSHTNSKSLKNEHNVSKGLPTTAKVALGGGGVLTMNYEMTGTQTFPTTSVPIFGSEYSRFPIQQGDKGGVLPFDPNIGNMSGQGPSGGSSQTRPGNLSPGMFMPFGNKDWEKVKPNYRVDYGVKPQEQQGGGGGGEQDKTFGCIFYDQVPSKSAGYVTIQTDKDGKTTFVVNINGDQQQQATNITADKSTIKHTVSDQITSKAGNKITHDVPQMDLTGNHTIQKVLNVLQNANISQITNTNQLNASGLASFAGGLTTGAFEVAPDIGVTPGIISAPGMGRYANDAAAAAAGVPVDGWYVNSSSGSLQSRLS